MAIAVKNPPANAGRCKRQGFNGEDSLEEEMATHSSILAWRIPWTEESGRLQPMRSQRVRHDSFFFKSRNGKDFQNKLPF